MGNGSYKKEMRIIMNSIFKNLPVLLSILSIVASSNINASEKLPAHDKLKPPFNVDLIIDDKNKRPVNRKVLGNNVQWVDHGDEILKRGELSFIEDKVTKAKRMGVTVLRYPGGSLADLYHWKDGIGSKKSRKKNSRFHGQGDDTILFGTAEFLTLTTKLNAEPLITVNIASGNAKEAADWVKLTNITRIKDKTGTLLPRVKYWEIGNEPYLIGDEHKELAMMPEEYARRANLFIKSMKAVDPSIVVGIPLRSDTLGGTPATPLQGFNVKVLKNMTQPFEYVSLHNAYFPYIWESVPDINTLYLSAMSASKFVKEDIEHTKKQLKEFFPNRNINIAITEYNAFFTIGKGKSDGYISSKLGALYVADMLALFSNMQDILMANYWSLSGNWFFGTIRQDNKLRPSYYVLEGFNRVLRGDILSIDIKSPTFKNKKAGFISKTDDIPLITAVVTSQDKSIRAFIINKHLQKSANLKFKLNDSVKVDSMKMQKLLTDRFIKSDDVDSKGWTSFEIIKNNTVNIPPHSMVIVEMQKK